MMPTIKYYARMQYSTAKGKKTPKYTIVAQAGYYPPMDALKGRDGLVSMYLLPNNSQKPDAPPMKLQAKGSLNFTGLKDYFVGGKLSGFAYGYPDESPTYSKDNKPNPFAEYKNDAFLMLLHNGKTTDEITPTEIELIVLDGAKLFAPAYCKQLQMGGFDDELNQMRKQAR